MKESNAEIEKAEKKLRLCAELNEFDETKRRERRSVALGKIKKYSIYQLKSVGNGQR